MNVLTCGSLFSGVGGMDLGLTRAGFRHEFFAESDEWRRGILARHWPGVPIHDDVRAVGQGAPAVDLLAGGFPCQDLSVAGRRAGLAGDRSGLFFEFARITDELRPRWLLIENVVGLLSSQEGEDFKVVLRTLADLGYGLCWRVLDARFFGVPQRRRRVFIVGHLGRDCGPAVRALGAGGDGDSASRGASWQEDSPGPGGRVAGTLSGKGACDDGAAVVVNALDRRQGGADDNDAQARHRIASTLQAGGGKRGYRIDAEAAAGGGQLVSFDAEHSNQAALGDDKAVLTRKLRRAIHSEATGVRRLTPTECERLMSWPDGWTLPGSDSRRYAGCGDGVVANVAEWIGLGVKRESEAGT